MKYPNLLVIGAQKAGTTWLHKRLKEHPDVFMTETKEVHHFTRPNWREMIEEYAAHFVDSGPETWAGESSPGYMWSADPSSEFYQPGKPRNDDVPGAVHEILGADVRLLVGLRHPVDRAVSAYFHHFRYNRFEPGQSILDIGKKFGIIDMGFYRKHMEMWLSRFDRSNFHVMLFDDLQTRPADCWNDVCDFLALKRVDLPAVTKAANPGFNLTFRDNAIQIDQDSKNPKNIKFMENGDEGSSKAASASITLDELKTLHEMYRDDIAWVEQTFDAARLGWSSKISDLVSEPVV